VTITLAQLIQDRHAAGLRVDDEFDALPPWQLELCFADVAPCCPQRWVLPVERRRANALNVEVGAPLPRCQWRSPDGRGHAWFLSGGSQLDYGPCGPSECPRLEDERGVGACP
jgi:hypothetical protein